MASWRSAEVSYKIPISNPLKPDYSGRWGITITGKLKGLLPGALAREWKEEVDLTDVPRGKYTLAVRVPNPLPNGLPLRFANATQDRDLDGWLSLTILVH